LKFWVDFFIPNHIYKRVTLLHRSNQTIGLCPNIKNFCYIGLKFLRILFRAKSFINLIKTILN